MSCFFVCILFFVIQVLLGILCAGGVFIFKILVVTNFSAVCGVCKNFSFSKLWPELKEICINDNFVLYTNIIWSTSALHIISVITECPPLVAQVEKHITDNYNQKRAFLFSVSGLAFILYTLSWCLNSSVVKLNITINSLHSFLLSLHSLSHIMSPYFSNE